MINLWPTLSRLIFSFERRRRRILYPFIETFRQVNNIEVTPFAKIFGYYPREFRRDESKAMIVPKGNPLMASPQCHPRPVIDAIVEPLLLFASNDIDSVWTYKNKRLVLSIAARCLASPCLSRKCPSFVSLSYNKSSNFVSPKDGDKDSYFFARLVDKNVTS